MSDADTLNIHTDGAARGNPGPAAYAFVITRPGHTAVEDNGCLGETTNNVAEYTAMVKALQRARELGGRRIVVHSDSELMVKQMLGQYKVKHEGLRPLYAEAQRLAESFDHVSYRHVRREQNNRADELCNQALDGAGKRAAASGGASAAEASREASAGEASRGASAPGHSGPRKAIHLPADARDEILDCLRAVACAWSAGNPNHPRPEEVWDQLWTILEDAGVLKSGHR